MKQFLLLLKNYSERNDIKMLLKNIYLRIIKNFKIWDDLNKNLTKSIRLEGVMIS